MLFAIGSKAKTTIDTSMKYVASSNYPVINTSDTKTERLLFGNWDRQSKLATRGSVYLEIGFNKVSGPKVWNLLNEKFFWLLIFLLFFSSVLGQDQKTHWTLAKSLNFNFFVV